MQEDSALFLIGTIAGFVYLLVWIVLLIFYFRKQQPSPKQILKITDFQDSFLIDLQAPTAPFPPPPPPPDTAPQKKDAAVADQTKTRGLVRKTKNHKEDRVRYVLILEAAQRAWFLITCFLFIFMYIYLFTFCCRCFLSVFFFYDLLVNSLFSFIFAGLRESAWTR
jgi:hypothetical protein